MKLRRLEIKDVPFMLEWMHDQDVCKYMNTNFATKTEIDCKKFIEDSWIDQKNLHLAIANINDEYLGTVSLKNIDYEKKIAEFAITIRKCAMGKNISTRAMHDILMKGVNKLKLGKIYWCVDRKNIRAVKFYDKNAYKRVLDVPTKIEQTYSEKELKKMIWYCFDNGEISC